MRRRTARPPQAITSPTCEEAGVKVTRLAQWRAGRRMNSTISMKARCRDDGSVQLLKTESEAHDESKIGRQLALAAFVRATLARLRRWRSGPTEPCRRRPAR